MPFPSPSACAICQLGNLLLILQDPVEMLASGRNLRLSSQLEHIVRAANLALFVCFAVAAIGLDPVCLPSCISQDHYSHVFVSLGPHMVRGV